MKATLLALLAVSGIASAQQSRQFRAQMFCNDFGDYSAQALVDYRQGIPEDVALLRVDGYICVDEATCEARKNVLRDGIHIVYDEVATKVRVREISGQQFMQAYDTNRIMAVSTCMKAAVK